MFTISWKQCWQLFAITWFPSDLIETVMAIISVVQIVSSASGYKRGLRFCCFCNVFLIGMIVFVLKGH
jgi:hypothetical protein